MDEHHVPEYWKESTISILEKNTPPTLGKMGEILEVWFSFLL